MPLEHLAANGSIICRQVEIASFKKNFRRQARPATQHPAAPDLATKREHHVGVTVIGAAIAVFPSSPAKLRHSHDHDLFHPIAEIMIKPAEPFAQFL